MGPTMSYLGIRITRTARSVSLRPIRRSSTLNKTLSLTLLELGFRSGRGSLDDEPIDGGQDGVRGWREAERTRWLLLEKTRKSEAPIGEMCSLISSSSKLKQIG